MSCFCYETAIASRTHRSSDPVLLRVTKAVLLREHLLLCPMCIPSRQSSQAAHVVSWPRRCPEKNWVFSFWFDWADEKQLCVTIKSQKKFEIVIWGPAWYQIALLYQECEWFKKCLEILHFFSWSLINLLFYCYPLLNPFMKVISFLASDFYLFMESWEVK